MEFGILFSFNYAETSNRILVVRSRQPSLWLLSWAGWVAGEGDLGVLVVAFMGPEQMAQEIPQGKPLVTGCYFGNREHSLGLTTFRQAISRTTVLYSVPLLCVSGNSVKPASWEREQHHPYGEELYHIVDEDETFSVDLANRPPVPVPRPEASAPGPPPPPDNEPYISKGKCGQGWCSAGRGEGWGGLLRASAGTSWFPGFLKCCSDCLLLDDCQPRQ